MAIGFNKATTPPQTLTPIMLRNFGRSQTWTVPFACKALCGVIGPGGGGAAATGASGGAARVAASGGGGGGFALGLYTLAAGDVITSSLPGGQNGGNFTTTGSLITANGTSGGVATLTSGNGVFSLSANGGAGGTAVATSGADTGLVTGAAGGTASGGNIMNVTGGSAGDVRAYNGFTTNAAASGGGAVGITGQSYSSGDIINGAGNYIQASGGASVFGSPFGYVNSAQNLGGNGGGYLTSYAGGSAAWARLNQDIYNTVDFPEYGTLGLANFNVLTDLTGMGGYNGSNIQAGYHGMYGGGGGGCYNTINSSVAAGAGGMAAGGGAAVFSGNTNGTVEGGRGGNFGGGGGGAARAIDNTGFTGAGAAGGSLAFVYIVEIL